MYGTFGAFLFALKFMILGSCNCILHQHCNCHRTNATGNRSDSSSLLFGFIKLNITTELFVLATVHANIDYNCAFFNHIAFNHL